MDYNSLKFFRKKNNFTQEQIAEKIGVSRQAIAKWERGETLPDIESLIALADIYEVTIDSLVRNVASYGDISNGKKYMFGLVRVNDKGQITLPKKCREVFGIEPSDTFLVLADKTEVLRWSRWKNRNKKGASDVRCRNQRTNKKIQD